MGACPNCSLHSAASYVLRMLPREPRKAMHCIQEQIGTHGLKMTAL